MRLISAFGLAMAVVALTSALVPAQAPPAPAPMAPAAGPMAPARPAAPKFKPRILAPGVVTTILSIPEEAETFDGPRNLVEIVVGVPNLDWQPNFIPKSHTLLEMAKKTTLRRSSRTSLGTMSNVWYLEFSFKPLRMIAIDVPQPGGKFQRKNILYMVYRVRNPGYHLNPVSKLDPEGNTVWSTEKSANFPIRFAPQFVLESKEPTIKKSYLDRVIPLAVPAIQRREDPATPLYNSSQLHMIDIPPDMQPRQPGAPNPWVWGVATWEDIDMRLDFFSIYVQGLTNAYRFADPPGAFRQGDPPLTGRRYAYKTLQLNFWWPGDAQNASEEFIRFGTPDDVESRWLYR